MQLVEVAALLTLVTATVGKKFTRCSLSKELARNGIPRGQMANWVCLVNSESGMNTRAMNRNRDGSVDYGLFQINNRYWCSPGPHNQCRVRCKGTAGRRNAGEEIWEDTLEAAGSEK
ncbi:lysozyme-like isoform X2 [Dermacentor andersoni]|uniref:lysozyme-like isoform X2 n=1 Tax=Dermacentor andersoni TaxID=34620 RepID=UPI002415C928|nr:lysozyme-like isoform X2 [Dermacentor andersoni]